MKKKLSVSQLLKQYMMLIVLVAIIVLGTILTKGILIKPMNVSNLINQNAYIVILAVGMLMCILTGGNVDLAVGSIVALIGAFAGTFIITWGWNAYLSVLLCLVLGILIGVWQGFWIAYVRIPAFIVTLSGQLVFRGLTLMILQGLTISPFPDSYMLLTTGFIGTADTRKTICMVVGIIIALMYIGLQISNRINRKRKGYELESMVSTVLRSVII
ncbi:MAG: sugar ABC transporter permease, partial [Aristaeellaceae bacterium]